MGLDLWFQEDVARILASTQETMISSMAAVAPVSPEEADAYQQGFVDALRSVAVAFGVAAPSVSRQHRPVRQPRSIDTGHSEPFVLTDHRVRRNGGRR